MKKYNGENSMDISLLLCTRDRSNYLPHVLDAFEALEYPQSWEIVIVDNGSKDETAVILDKFAKNSRHNVVLAYEAKPGCGNARNRALQIAQGEVVAFTDDDCYPQRDFLVAVMRAFEDTTVGYMGGRVLLYDPQDLPITIKISEKFERFSPGSFIGPGYIHGANFAFRRKALESIGGFDSLLGPGTPYPSEDCDALIRMSYSGWGGVYWPEAVVSHHHRRRGEKDREAIENYYLAARGAFYFKTLVYSPNKLKTLVGLIRSIKCFGLKAWFSEIPHGVRYLKSRHSISRGLEALK